MDNQNNNFENINRFPREPDFPPKAYEYVTPGRSINTEEAVGENNAENPNAKATSADNLQPQAESENPFNQNSANNMNGVGNQQNYDDSGIPYIPSQSFQNNYNSVNFQSRPTSQFQQNYENNQSFTQDVPGANYPYGANMPGQNYNVNNYNNVQSPYNNYPQQGYPRPYTQNNGGNTGYPYNQGYQPYSNPQNTSQSLNRQINPYSNSANKAGMTNPSSPSANNTPPKRNIGLKVFLICLSVIFGICLIGFVATISYSLGQSGNSSGGAVTIIPTEHYDYNKPDQTETKQEEHNESDYSDKINPDYSGLKLENPVSDKNNTKYTSEYTFNAVSPSVVGIVCYYGEITDVSECATQASGIIISEDGYIITNSHLINNSKTSYALQVITSDGKEYTAGVVAYDSRSDIALIKADATGLKPATFGKSEEMSIGSSVVAIGNPGGIGYQNSMTSGVISALNRTVPSNSNVKYIQTDAAINPGNSGGPLCNLYGQIIGMNTSKIVSEKYEGMGFSIPSEAIKSVVDELMKNGYVTGRVKIGLVGVAISAQDRATYNLPSGILVDSIDPEGPLKDSDIQANDIITKVDGESISNFGDIYAVLEKHKSGDKIKIEVYRSPYISGKEKTFEVEVTLVEDKSE